MSVQSLDAYVICFGLLTSSTNRSRFAFYCSILIFNTASRVLRAMHFILSFPCCFIPFFFVSFGVDSNTLHGLSIVLQPFFEFSLLAIVRLFEVAALPATIDNSHVQRISLWVSRYIYTHCARIKYFNRWTHKVFICRIRDDKRTIPIP